MPPVWASSRFMKSNTRSGERNMPRMLDTVAEHTAAPMSPRAIDTKVTEDCTVEGNRLR